MELGLGVAGEKVQIVNPLPQRFLTTDAGIGGRIKLRPEDFLVDELPLYEPSGRGEHVYLRLQKTAVSHGEMMAVIRKHFRVKDKAIGYAGMKDKMGITQQLVSVQLHGRDLPDVNLPHARIKVLWAARHGNKLRRGHLAGNRFSIRIREVEPARVPRVLQTLRTLERVGVPNYFDAQRFGYRQNNHIVGLYVMRRQWRELVLELLGTGGSTYPEYQQKRRELFEAGRYAEASPHWTTADAAEVQLIRALARGVPLDRCIRALKQSSLLFWVSATQSAMFNRVLDRRLDAGQMDVLCEGDIAWKHDSRGMFHVTPEELADGVLAARLKAFEISPSGPLWGKGMMQCAGIPGEIEREALHAMTMSEAELSSMRDVTEGTRRAFRVRISNVEVDGGADNFGPYIRVAFDLPRGAYATVVMREIMHGQVAEGSDAE